MENDEEYREARKERTIIRLFVAVFVVWGISFVSWLIFSEPIHVVILDTSFTNKEIWVLFFVAFVLPMFAQAVLLLGDNE